MIIHFDELLKLQRFAEGGDGAGDGGNAGVTGQEVAAPVSTRARNRNPLADVKFGIQEDEVAGQTAPGEQPDEVEAPAEETYESLIKGKYKADYDKDVQRIVQHRLRGAKETEARLNSLNPVLQIMAQRYGIDADNPAAIDVDALTRAVSEDKALYEAEAARQGVPVEIYMKSQQLDRQQKAFQAQQQAIKDEAIARQQYANLLTQAAAIKAAIPGFDLDVEMQNPDFGRMVLNAGVPVEAAYYAVHHKDIQAAQRRQQLQMTQYAVQQTAEKTAKAVASGSRRPTENGVAKVTSPEPRTDPRSLTKAERAEIRRRVAAGAKIVF